MMSHCRVPPQELHTSEGGRLAQGLSLPGIDPAYTPQAPRRRVQALGLQAGGPSGQSISVSSELLFCIVGISASASLLGRVGFFWSRGEASGLLKVFC